MDRDATLQNIITTGALASVTTTAAAVICGELEHQTGIAPINAVSHIVWGDRAARQNAASWQYTVVGSVLNAAAVTSWAAVHEMFSDAVAPRKDPVTALATGASVAALAWFTDYHIVPRWLTPGFEKRLSNGSLWAIYSTLALSLAAGRLAQRVPEFSQRRDE